MKKNQSILKTIMLAVAMLVLSGTTFNALAQNDEPFITVTFQVDESYSFTQEMDRCRTIEVPPHQTKAGKVFLGWYNNSEYNGTPWIFGAQEICEDTTLYAKWEPIVSICSGETYEIEVKIHNATTITAEWEDEPDSETVPQPQFDETNGTWVWTYTATPEDEGKTIKVRLYTDYGEGDCEETFAESFIEFAVKERTTKELFSVTGTQDICSGETTTLTAIADNTITNPVFKWYTTVDGTTPFWTEAEYSTGALFAPTTFYVSVEGTNYCEGNADENGRYKVEVTVNQRPETPELTVEPEEVVICENATIDADFLKDYIKINNVGSEFSIEYYLDEECTERFTDTIAIFGEAPYKLYAIVINTTTKCTSDLEDVLTIEVNVHDHINAPELKSDADIYICENETIDADFLKDYIKINNVGSEFNIEYYLDEECTKRFTDTIAIFDEAPYKFYAIVRNNTTKCTSDLEQVLPIEVKVHKAPVQPVLKTDADLTICKGLAINAAFLENLIDNTDNNIGFRYYTVEVEEGIEIEKAFTSITAEIDVKYTIYAVAVNKTTDCESASALKIEIEVLHCECETPAQIEIIYQGTLRTSKK